jgi:SAM-dependent methyltransferase
MPVQPHFVRDYRRSTRYLLRTHALERAMELAVGGDYVSMGERHVEVLRRHGLTDQHFLVDVGCGSGRTAYALRGLAGLRYHGTDVVPELVAFARTKVARPDWRFSVVERLAIPEPSGAADFVAMFSVLTHLTPNEGRIYLADAARVLRPGGKIVASFLDATIPAHRRMAGGRIEQFVRRFVTRKGVKSVVLTKEQITRWAADLVLRVEFFGHERIGQSYVILTK